MAAIEEEAKLNEEFRKSHAAQLKALESKGHADPLFDEKLDRLNEAMTKQERIHNQWVRQQEEREKERKAREEEIEKREQERLNKIEAKVNRTLLGLGGSGETEATVQERQEKKAFNSWIRKGEVKMQPEEVKLLLRSDDSAGGYLAPSDMEKAILKKLLLFSPVRDLVTVVTISGPSLRQPKLTNGPTAAKRVGEVETRVEATNPSYGMVEIGTPELYAEHRVTNWELDDAAYDIEAELAQFMGWQFAVAEGAEFVSGIGTTGQGGQLQGILDASANITAVNTGGATITADSIVDLIHALPSPYVRNARLLLNRKSLGAVRKLKTSGSGEYVWQRGYDLANPATIAGERYTEVPDMNDEGSNKYPIAYGDFGLGYKLVQKAGTPTLRDPFTLQSVGQVKLTARRRVGGQVVLPDAIRILKCA